MAKHTVFRQQFRGGLGKFRIGGDFQMRGLGRRNLPDGQ
jgi:hypothetical protein